MSNIQLQTSTANGVLDYAASSADTRPTGDSGISAIGLNVYSDYAVRYSIVLVLAWIGAMKFTAYEAAGIEGLVASSPILGWLYGVVSLQAASNIIGMIEIAIAAALAVGPIYRPAALFGAFGAIATFSTTLTFMFTAPGWEASLGGFPALSVVPGQFLLKDIVLLAASVSLLSKAISSRVRT